MDKDKLVEVFPRAYREWRLSHTDPKYPTLTRIPEFAGDLLDNIVLELERAAALRSHAPK